MLAVIGWICAGLASHGVVAVIGIMYGKSHPKTTEKVAAAIAEAEKKIGIKAG